GAIFYSKWDSSRKLAFFQGGWRNANMLDDVYAPPTIQEVASRINVIVNRASFSLNTIKSIELLEKYYCNKDGIDGLK
ncbi:unnamed protein product, partial [Amoebophrya sp. A25]